MGSRSAKAASTAGRRAAMPVVSGSSSSSFTAVGSKTVNRCCQAAAASTDATPTCAPCRPIGSPRAPLCMSNMWLMRCSTPDRHAVVPATPVATPRMASMRVSCSTDPRSRRETPGDQASMPRPNTASRSRGAVWKLGSSPTTEARYQSAGATNIDSTSPYPEVLSRSGAPEIVVTSESTTSGHREGTVRFTPSRRTTDRLSV